MGGVWILRHLLQESRRSDRCQVWRCRLTCVARQERIYRLVGDKLAGQERRMNLSRICCATTLAFTLRGSNHATGGPTTWMNVIRTRMRVRICRVM